MWQGMWPPPGTFWKTWGHGWYPRIDFYCPFLEIVVQRMAINTRIVRAHLHLLPFLISARHSIWSRKWLQIILRVLVGVRSHLHLVFFVFCIHSDLLRLWIDLQSTIVHLLSTQLKRCSIQQRDPPWNNEAEKEWGQIETFNLTARMLLMHERDCIYKKKKKSTLRDFKCSQRKIHSELPKK